MVLGDCQDFIFTWIFSKISAEGTLITVAPYYQPFHACHPQ